MECFSREIKNMKACFTKISIMVRASMSMKILLMKANLGMANFLRAGKFGQGWFMKENFSMKRPKGMDLWNILMAQNTWGNLKII